MNDEFDKEFEILKQEIEDIKVRMIAYNREKERLQSEVQELEKKIKDQFGIDPTLFESELSKLQESLQTKKKQLKEKIEYAKEKING